MAATVTLRDDPYFDWENGMEFTLTYAGKLLSYTTDERRKASRALHVHDIRREFHKQLDRLWKVHPLLVAYTQSRHGLPEMMQIFESEGFRWLPLASEANHVVCKLDITLLRPGPPGQALSDIDNRLKTLFDALRKPDGPLELGAGSKDGQATPQSGEDPFYVLLQDDKLITHVSVTTDELLEAVPDVPPDNAVRLLIRVTLAPYGGGLDALDFIAP